MSDRRAGLAPEAGDLRGSAAASAEDERSARRLGLLVLALVALVAAIVTWRYTPPAPRSSDAPSREFSGGRARAVQATLLADEAPHPTGTPANDAVRGRVVAELRRLGYAPEVSTAIGCGPHRGCARVSNVVAVLPGEEREARLLLAAHYDSVGAGPGASDDGAGVAALLEIARALREGPRTRSSIALLVDDGEELGLLGAEAFVASHPLAREVRVVVNLEARGTTGPSMMFETSQDNAWLVRALASSLERPITSSLFYAVYKALPNDTDVSVFKRHGIQAANFAFLGGATRYHTPRDDLAHSDARSLQHQGDNGLALARALASEDLAHTPPGDAVWFDVLGLGVVAWPEGATGALGLAASGLVAAAIALALRARRLGLGAVSFGLCVVPASVAGAALAGLLVTRILRASGAAPAAFIATPAAALVAVSAAAFASSAATTLLIARRAGAAGVWVGTWGCWAAAALALAWSAPAVSFLFLAPTLVAGLAGVLPRLLRLDPRRCDALAAALPAVAATALWLPLILLLPDAIGLESGAVLGAVTGLAATTLMPIFAALGARERARITLVTGGLGLFALVVACFVPPWTADSPARASLVHAEVSGAARWIVDAGPSATLGRAPASLAAAMGPNAREEPLFPWSPRPVLAFAAPPSGALPPELVVRSSRTEPGGARRLRAMLRSVRGAPWLELHVPEASSIARVHVVGAVPEGAGELVVEPGGFRGLTLAGAPSEGFELDITLAGDSPARIVLVDLSPGVPSEGSALLAARGRLATASQRGDLTVVTRAITLD